MELKTFFDSVCVGLFRSPPSHRPFQKESFYLLTPEFYSDSWSFSQALGFGGKEIKHEYSSIYTNWSSSCSDYLALFTCFFLVD